MEFSLKNTFNDRLVELNFRKASPGLMATRNVQLFRKQGEGSDVQTADDADIGDWVLVNDRLIRADDDEVKNRGLPTLTANEFLRYIIRTTRGPIMKG